MLPATVTLAPNLADSSTPLPLPALVLACLTAASLGAQVPTVRVHDLRPLDIGQPAPSLEGLEWLRGDPIDVTTGRIHVVEFWTPTCPLSRMAIPKLTKLQRAYDEDEVLVVAIVPKRFERKQATVENFLAEWSGRIDFAVAYDKNDTVSSAWLDGARIGGYPVAFVVDEQGRIAWIGSPLGEMARVVERIDAGEFDLKTAASVAKLERDLAKARARQDRGAVLRTTRQWIAIEPHRATPWIARFEVLTKNLADTDNALACTREALKRLARNPHELAQFANEALFAVDSAVECHKLGLEACERAFAVDEDDPRLALAYFSALAATQSFEPAAAMAKTTLVLAEDDAELLATLPHHFLARHGSRFAKHALAAIRRVIELEPDDVQHDAIEFSILAMVMQADAEAQKVGERILVKAKSDVEFLNHFSWKLVDQASLRGRFDRLALRAAELVSARPNGDDWMFVDTLARCKFLNGYIEQALELQDRALKGCDDPSYVPQLMMRRQEYSAAVETKRRSARGK